MTAKKKDVEKEKLPRKKELYCVHLSCMARVSSCRDVVFQLITKMG
jgi:hypothetical protein